MDITTLPTNPDKKFNQLEKIIEKGIQHFIEVGTALLIIRDEKLYRDAYARFEDYCKLRWGFNSSRARQLIASAKVNENIKSVTNVTPKTESQLRPLAHLDPEQQKKVWDKAVKTAPNGKITARHVEAVAEEVEGDNDKELESEFPVNAKREAINSGAPAHGLQLAKMATRTLERITEDDIQREDAFNHVRRWLGRHQKEGKTPIVTDSEIGPIEDSFVMRNLKRAWGMATAMEKEMFLDWLRENGDL